MKTNNIIILICLTTSLAHATHTLVSEIVITSRIFVNKENEDELMQYIEEQATLLTKNLFVKNDTIEVETVIYNLEYTHEPS